MMENTVFEEILWNPPGHLGELQKKLAEKKKRRLPNILSKKRLKKRRKRN